MSNDLNYRYRKTTERKQLQTNETVRQKTFVQKDELTDLNLIRQRNRRVDDTLARVLQHVELCNVLLDGDQQRLAEFGRRVLVLEVLIHEAQARAWSIVDAHHEVERRRKQGARQIGEFFLRVD